MQNRCREEYEYHEDYFDRGIRVDPQWLGKGGYERFLAHVGRRPSREHSLDRIDNNGNYTPGNVRWATRDEQQNNKRDTKRLTFEELTLSAAQWARRRKIPVRTIYNRLKAGWSMERVLAVR